jgi:hypothetical protein
MLKQKWERIKGFPPPSLDQRPRQFLFLNQRGAPFVINNMTYFSEERFRHLKTQQCPETNFMILNLFLGYLLGPLTKSENFLCSFIS